MLFFLDDRSYKATDSHAKFKNLYVKLTGRNYGMAVTYKVQ